MSGKHVVLSTRLYTLHPDGKGDPRRQKKHFRGDVLTGLSADDVERFTKAGAIAPHSSDEAKLAQAAPAVAHPAEVSDSDALQVPTHQTVPSASAIVAEASIPGPPGPTSIVSAADALQVPTHQTVPSASAIVAEASIPGPPGPTSIVSVGDGPESVTRPAKSATKDALVDYAVKSGQMSREQADATSRDELRDTLK